MPGSQTACLSSGFRSANLRSLIGFCRLGQGLFAQSGNTFPRRFTSACQPGHSYNNGAQKAQRPGHTPFSRLDGILENLYRTHPVLQNQIRFLIIKYTSRIWQRSSPPGCDHFLINLKKVALDKKSFVSLLLVLTIMNR